ncbi:uncharacterized protein LOC113295223 [Papaver somniferum]|uniref:uncharacterized protein LOC113295223 n=1 Tax=Papaver somniferum TaxID=3469 RepID=UPI000E701824|nr:uncharacterized protein LOC113295223 [Papaver somniferum]
MQSANLGINNPRILRRTITSAQVVKDVADEWSFILLGKLICKDPLNHEKVKDEEYKFDIPLADYKFLSQVWCVQLRNLKQVILNEKLVNDICLDIGKKVSPIGRKRIPRGHVSNIVFIEVNLREPLRRGGWSYTPNGDKVWVIYHFERQPYKLCKKCWVVEHVEENCEWLSQEHKVKAMLESEFAEYSLTEEGKKFLAAYILASDVNSNMDTMEGASSSMTNSETETIDEGEARKRKRTREDVSSLKDANPNPNHLTHNNPILQSDDLMMEGTGADDIKSAIDLHMNYQHIDGAMKAIENSTTQIGGFVAQNQQGCPTNYQFDGRSKVAFSCMYGALCNGNRDAQWDFIRQFRHSTSYPWILLGDMNFILSNEEKSGGHPHSQSVLDTARDFVNSLGLQDFSYSGNMFTLTNRIHGAEHIQERLDRFLGDDYWFRLFLDSHVYHLAPIARNHSPIILASSRSSNAIKRPNKFNKCWLRDHSCKDVVSNNWKSQSNGSDAFKHKISLKQVRYALRDWNYNIFGNVQSNLNDIRGQIESLHSQGIVDTSNNLLSDLLKQLNYWQNIEEDFWKQRAKDDLIKFDDRNTRYFHTKANFRRKKTHIESLQDSTGIWLTDRYEIAINLRNHFSSIGKTSNPSTDPNLFDCVDTCVTNADNIWLMSLPSSEEIKQVVFSMKPWTSPGPDGFPPGFYQSMWDIVGEDTVKMVHLFFQGKYILKENNHNFISLIPKVDCPKIASDFRPISLCNTSYKIIYKILSNRLKPLIGKIISLYQAAFVQGRLMTDNIVIAHELINTMKKHKYKNGLMALKLDMSKAFDRIEWPFLHDCLKALGFCEDWCHLINQCVSTVSFSVMLNGVPGDQFWPTRGLIQGDPLYPYLFIFCMDVLSKNLMYAEAKNLIKGIKVTQNAPTVSHLFFADDCLIFTKANPKEVRVLNSILEKFSKASGQAINFDKSAMAFSKKTENQTKHAITQILNIKNMALQDKYLGVPLLLQHKKSESFSGMMSKFGGRLSLWKSSHFNQPGRTILSQTVLGSLATHQMAVFPMPKKITDKIDSIQKNFFWHKDNNGRKWYPKSWSIVTSPKDKGGLNIRRSAEFNMALLGKLAWSQGSWIWRGICQGLEFVKQNYCWEIADGKNINVWKDVWIPSLGKKVPSTMYSSNISRVSQLIDDNTRNWNHNMLKALFPIDIVDQILQIRIPLIGKDQVRWLGTRTGCYTVKSAYHILLQDSLNQQNLNIPNFPWSKLWKVQLPPKILHLIWRILHNCVATRDKLHKVVSNIASTCPLCKQYDESCQHMFIDCPVTNRLWFALDHTLIGNNSNHNLYDWFSSLFNANNFWTQAMQVKIRYIGCVLWWIWKYRCVAAFDNKQLNPSEFIATVKEYINDCEAAIRSIPVNSSVSRNIYWKFPAKDYLKLNFDASFITDKQPMGYGLILRSDTCSFNGAKGGKTFAVDEEQAEVVTSLEALKWAKAKNIQFLEIEGDCSNVVNAINGDLGSIKWTTNSVVHECISIMKNFEFWFCQHAKREANEVSDTLAKKSRSLGDGSCYENPPIFLLGKLEKDNLNVTV